MSKIFILIAVILISNIGISQTEKDNYKQVSTRFVSFYNVDKNDSIVAMFSPEMNAALPIEKFTQVSTVLTVPLGAMQ